MNKKIISIYTLVVLIASILVGIVATRRADNAGIEVRPRHLVIGNGKPNELLKGNIYLTNNGSKQINFNVTKSCGCTSVSPQSGRLQIGGQQVIQVEVRLPDYANSEKSVTVEVHSDDPNHPLINCSVIARCPSPIRVSPADIEFGRVRPDVLGRKTRELSIESAPGQPSLTPGDLEATVKSGNFEVVRSKFYDGYITFQLTPRTLEKGDIYDSLEINHVKSKLVVRIPIHIGIIDPITIIPSKVYLEKVYDQEIIKNFIIKLPTDGPSLGSISTVDQPKGIKITEQVDCGVNCKKITIVFNKDIQKTNFSLTLKSEGIDNKFKIDINFF